MGRFNDGRTAGLFKERDNSIKLIVRGVPFRTVINNDDGRSVWNQCHHALRFIRSLLRIHGRSQCIRLRLCQRFDDVVRKRLLVMQTQ